MQPVGALIRMHAGSPGWGAGSPWVLGSSPSWPVPSPPSPGGTDRPSHPGGQRSPVKVRGHQSIRTHAHTILQGLVSYPDLHSPQHGSLTVSARGEYGLAQCLHIPCSVDWNAGGGVNCVCGQERTAPAG